MHASFPRALLLFLFSRAGEHHPPCHQGRGWHLVSLAMLQMSDCASLYAAVPSNFLQMRSLLGQNCHFLHFSLLFPLKSFSLLFWASQNVTASMLLLCYYTGNEIYSWKSLSQKGDIHLHESTQLEIKTQSSI